MKLSIIAILISLSATYLHAQELDTIAITAPTHLNALPELLKESQELQQAKAQLERAIKDNSEKVMLILSAYAEPDKVTGVTPDLKSIIVKK